MNLIRVLLVLLPCVAFARDWPNDDVALDKLLREKSRKYKDMAATIEAQAKSGHTRQYEECFYRQRGGATLTALDSEEARVG